MTALHRAQAVRPATPVEDDAALVISGMSKHFVRGHQRTDAIHNMDLRIRKHEFVCMVGASGCGKSTLLNIVAGLDTPSSGTVDTVGSRVALMFQEAALFPWLDVRGNIELPTRLAGHDAARRKSTVDELLHLVRLQDFARHRPHELSGGMRQRVALARALAQDANLLLMDEPFAALDAIMRDHLHEEIERIVQERGLTVLFVTHNVRESVRLGDRVLILRSHPGRVADEYTIEIPRPRRIESAEVADQSRLIIDRLKEFSSHVE